MKVDDLSRPYHQGEVEAIRKAIDRTGRPMVLSTSPGATPLSAGEHVLQHANMWRVSDDFWDKWPELLAQFKRLRDWSPYRGPGHFPDADMLPLGVIDLGKRTTRFTLEEQYTLMTLWCIARSPLMLGADMTRLDDFTLSLLTNEEVLAVNQRSRGNHELFDRQGLIAWVAEVPGCADKYLALFNTREAPAKVPIKLSGPCQVRDLWQRKDQGKADGQFIPELPSHGAKLFRLSPGSLGERGADQKCGLGLSVLAASGAVESFPPSSVQLLDGPFKQNMERNAGYLLSLEPDRLLHNTRQYCGLQPKAELYGGWEALGVAGHTLGHYLTALSHQYAVTGDKRFRQRIDYIVAEMAACQPRYGDGYIGALPPVELAALRGLKQGQVEMKGAWVPWYTEHKVLAGLRDAWVLGGCTQAREVALRLADWVDDLTAHLTPEQQQGMLQTEFGGMSEVLVDLYALTGNARYLNASRRFYHRAVLEPLLAGRDELPGKHANTQIPKIVGEARRYEVTGAADSRTIAESFWNLVVSNHTFVIGGNSDREHFFPVNQAERHLGPETAETCNTYNMLRLTTHLLQWNPQVVYGDFYERALYNQILPSQEPRHAMFTYFVSLKPGHFRTYSNPTNSFWCCVGTGLENHTKYGEAIYFHGADDLYVNLFIPSELTWRAKTLVLDQRTTYPNSEETELTFKSRPSGPLTLKVRCPAWATAPLGFQINGRPAAVEGRPGRFAEIRHDWRKGDRVRITIPLGLRTEPLRGASNRLAFLYGPLVLAGDLGPVPASPTFPNSSDHVANERAPGPEVPVLVSEEGQALVKALQRLPGPALAFRTGNLARLGQVTLRPFNAIPYDYYTVYWEVLSPAAWATRQQALAQAQERQRQEQAQIVDEVYPGEQQSEVDHGLTSQRSVTGDFQDRKWRDAREGGYFAFQMKVQSGVPQLLRCTYWGDDALGRTFDIVVEGQPIATQTLEHTQPGSFFDVEYPIPAALLAGKDTVKVRFQAHPGRVAGGLFYCAVVRRR